MSMCLSTLNIGASSVWEACVRCRYGPPEITALSFPGAALIDLILHIEILVRRSVAHAFGGDEKRCVLIGPFCLPLLVHIGRDLRFLAVPAAREARIPDFAIWLVVI